MFAKCLSIVLALSLYLCTTQLALAQMNVTAQSPSAEKAKPQRNNYAPATATDSEKETKLVEKVKAGITKLGTGPNARIEVKLRDKTKLRGYVSELSDGHFVVVDEKTGAATQVAYPQVKQVRGNNLSTGAKIAIGIGIAVFIIIGVVQIFKGNG